MQIYILIDDPDYESSTMIAAYVDLGQAERRMNRMKRQKELWHKKQEKLEEQGSLEAYSNPPHSYDDLRVVPITLIGDKS
jgi:hypothetical protein